MIGARWGSLAAAIMLAAAATATGQADVPQASKPSLYDRLGGLDGVATLVDHLVDRMAADTTLQANPYVHEAMTRVSSAGLKYRVTTMLCAATGGPQAYAGRSMRAAHAHLRITGREWRVFSGHLAAVFEELGTGEAERTELRAIVDGAMGDVVLAGELDGQTYTVERGETGQQTGVADEIVFNEGRVAATSDQAAGMPPAIYVATVKDDATMFEAETVGANGAKVVWSGSIRAGKLEATATSSKEGASEQKRSFVGNLKK